MDSLNSSGNTPESATLSAPAPPPKKIIRRKGASDPLRRPVKRDVRASSGPGPAPNAPNPVKSSQPPVKAIQPTVNILEEDTSGWARYPLKTTKRALMEGLRFHVAKLSAHKKVNILDPEQFTVPIRLHRRDPRAPKQGVKEEQMAQAAIEDSKQQIDPEEQKKLDEAKAAKDAELAAIQATIAPFGGAQRQKKQAFKKKTQQVFHTDEAARKLKYEEFFPWFIEDFDNKQTWESTLEGGLSEGNRCIFVMEGDCFRLIPVNKWYKFTRKDIFEAIPIEQAEAELKKKSRMGRWFMQVTKHDEKEAAAKEAAENKAAYSRMTLVKGDRLKNRPMADTMDADEIDFDEVFQDDEEAPIMEGEEEENREIEKRMKREQLQANVFDLKGEKEWEAEEKERLRLERLKKQNGKTVKKLLKGHEKNMTYDSDSDDNEFASGSDEDSDSAKKEEERKKAEEKKREEERQMLEEDRKRRQEEEAMKKASGQNGKVDDKSRDPKKGDKFKQLKRSAGSDPYQSESGTDTGTRKKARQGTGSGVAGGAGKKRALDGVGSDIEAGEATSGESAAKKLKARQADAVSGRPVAGTQPSGGTSRVPSADASRAASPSVTPAPGNRLTITPDEIRTVFKQNPKGIEIKEFLAYFRGRVDKSNLNEFMTLIKGLSTQKGKLLLPKNDS